MKLLKKQPRENKITQGQQVMLINVYDSRIYGAVKSDWENLKEALSH